MKNSISRSGLEVVMLLEGGTPHLADEPPHLPYLRGLHRQHHSDRSFATV